MNATLLNGVMLLWFLQTAAALLFVAIDIRSTPESPVLKWGFLLLTAYTGVVDSVLNVLGSREPRPWLHERFTAVRWRQTLGSTMHCVAGDGVGILAGAVVAWLFGLTGLAEVALEYVLGFAFGWTIFQSLFMRDMAGGSYRRALTSTFIPELLSMNFLMAGMVPTVRMLRMNIPAAEDPTTWSFWFVTSMGLLVGFIIAYPMNWWLVANHLKHGMMTVRAPDPVAGASTDMSEAAHSGMTHGGMEHGGMMHGGMTHSAMEHGAPQPMSMGKNEAPRPPIWVMGLLSFVALAAGTAIAFLSRL